MKRSLILCGVTGLGLAATSATDWEPPPGMVKRQCDWCRYFFAAPPDAAEPLCPDCVALGSRPASADPT